MTEPRDPSLERLFAEYTKHVDYVRGSTALIAALPLIYGIVTFVWGDAIWAYNPIYRTALEVPGAPQSWGVVFFVLGSGTIWFAALKKHRATAFTTIVTAVVLASYMISFLVETHRVHGLYGIPPAVAYGIFALAFMNRSRFAFSLWQLETGWEYWWNRPGTRLHYVATHVRHPWSPEE